LIKVVSKPEAYGGENNETQENVDIVTSSQVPQRGNEAITRISLCLNLRPTKFWGRVGSGNMLIVRRWLNNGHRLAKVSERKVEHARADPKEQSARQDSTVPAFIRLRSDKRRLDGERVALRHAS
jgi:hypothetical protein